MRASAALVVLGLGAIVPTVGAAQRLDPDWTLWAKDSREHFAAGAVIGTATRLVFPRASPAQRLAITASIALAWELGQASATQRHGPGYGASPKDWLLGIAGAALVEVLWARF